MQGPEGWVVGRDVDGMAIILVDAKNVVDLSEGAPFDV